MRCSEPIIICLQMCIIAHMYSHHIHPICLFHVIFYQASRPFLHLPTFLAEIHWRIIFFLVFRFKRIEAEFPKKKICHTHALHSNVNSYISHMCVCVCDERMHLFTFGKIQIKRAPLRTLSISPFCKFVMCARCAIAAEVIN